MLIKLEKYMVHFFLFFYSKNKICCCHITNCYFANVWSSFPLLISAIKREGLKDKIVIIIGGAAVTKEDANSIGVLFGETREDAVALAKKAMEQKLK